MKVQIPSIPDCNLFVWRVFNISLWHFSVLAGWKTMHLHPAPLQPFWMSLSQYLLCSRRHHILKAMSQASPLMLMQQAGGRLIVLPAYQVLFVFALSEGMTSTSALFKVGSCSLPLEVWSSSGDVTAAAQLSASTQDFGDLDTSSFFHTVSVFPFLRFRLQSPNNVFSLFCFDFMYSFKLNRTSCRSVYFQGSCYMDDVL